MKTLLEEAGARLEDICKIVVYVNDIRHREPVYNVIGRWLKGSTPARPGSSSAASPGPSGRSRSTSPPSSPTRPHADRRVIRPDSLAAFAAIPAPTGAEGARREWLERRLRRPPGERAADGVGNLIWRFGAQRSAPARDGAHRHGVRRRHAARDAPRRRRAGRPGDRGQRHRRPVARCGCSKPCPPCPPGRPGVHGRGGGARQPTRRAPRLRRARPQAALALEGHGLDEVITEHVGSLRARVTVTGRAATRGRTAARRAPPTRSSVSPTELAGRRRQRGTISGGRAVNAIADHAEMLVELRSLGPGRARRLRPRSVGWRSSRRCGRLEIVGRRPAGRIAAGHPLLAAVSAVRARLGLPRTDRRLDRRQRRRRPAGSRRSRSAVRAGAACTRSASASAPPRSKSARASSPASSRLFSPS